MPKISAPTKSFIVLFLLAVFGVFLCLNLWSDLDKFPKNGFGQVYYGSNQNRPYALMPALSGTQNQRPPGVDTSAWPTYSNKEYNFSFKYKPDWKVLPAIRKNGYTILQVDPGKKYYNIKIYISDKDYYVMGGLPTQNQIIGGQPGLNVNNMLFGVKAGGYYYTFDVGLSVSLTPNFNALVNSVKFGS